MPNKTYLREMLFELLLIFWQNFPLKIIIEKNSMQKKVFDIKILKLFPNKMFQFVLIDCRERRTVEEVVSNCNGAAR